MLQRVLATLLCLLGAAAIGLGVASATVWRSPESLVATATAADGALLVTEPGVLDMAADEVMVRATAESGDVVLALGRTSDVDAWVGTTPHTRVTGLADRETLSTRDVTAAEGAETDTADGAATDAPATQEPAADDAPAEEPAAEEPAAEEPAAEPVSPAGSDLWLEEEAGEGEATLRWESQEGRYSVLAAATGEGAGPVTLTLTWPQVVTTPWLLPALVAGTVLLLAGLLWWAAIVVRARRARLAGAADVRTGPLEGRGDR